MLHDVTSHAGDFKTESIFIEDPLISKQPREQKLHVYLNNTGMISLYWTSTAFHGLK